MATTDVDEATTQTVDAPTVDDRDPANLIPGEEHAEARVRAGLAVVRHWHAHC